MFLRFPNKIKLMKKGFLFVTAAIIFWTCNTPKPVVQAPAEKKIEILCLAENCEDSDPLSLFEFNGIGFTKIKELDRVGKDSFILKASEGRPRFLYIGTETEAKLPVVFSDEDMVIKGTCEAYRRAEISHSEYNSMYNDILKVIKGNKRTMQGQLGAFRKAAKDPSQQSKIKSTLAALDQSQRTYLDSIKEAKPFLANIVALGTMSNYPNNASKYSNEVDFFAAEYFKHADLKNPVYNDIPYLFEAFKEFSQTLAAVNLPQEIVNDLVNQNLMIIPDSSSAMRYALGGTLLGLQAKNHPSFTYYGNRFLQKFGTTTDAASVVRLESQLEQAKSFVTGGEAPEIALNTPDGEVLKLSELRGQIVLIDFWASWCGPCRKENPNVVKVYNKYKNQGFEILGVSLDKTKDRWLAAIEKDQLTWPHVSDLKGWQSEAAKTYGVRSIPATVLLDKEGKIIARNLRGSMLERKLAEIFE